MNPYIRLMKANKGKGEFRAEGNTIWLYDVIASDEDEAYFWGGVAPKDFMAALSKTTGPVTLRINSPGGSVFGAQAMVSAMRAHPHAITARVDSLAASAASVIAANAAQTVMVPGSMLMIHRAWGVAMGNGQDMHATGDLLEKIDGLIAESYAARAGDKGDKDRFAALMAAETWFTPEEALAAGLADVITEENTQRAKNRWDLSAFVAAPVLPALEADAGGDGVTAAPEEDDRAQAAAAAFAARDLRMKKAVVAARLNPI
jgi:ATP-dependent Clp protease, protease subunit